MANQPILPITDERFEHAVSFVLSHEGGYTAAKLNSESQNVFILHDLMQPFLAYMLGKEQLRRKQKKI